jgi:hypothetical protein
MSTSTENQQPQHHIAAALCDVAASLQKAAQDAEGLSRVASEALRRASADVARAAESLQKHAAATAKSVLQKAVHEVQEHPVASLAAAITAASALVSVLTSKDHGDA